MSDSINGLKYCISQLGNEIVEEIMCASDIGVVFDRELRYVAVNDAAARQLRKSPDELIGKCIMDLYPEITASGNHRNLLKAQEGEIVDDIVEGRNGEYFRSQYTPVKVNDAVGFIVVKASCVKPKC